MVALVAGETVEMINVVLGLHDHLECGDGFRTGRTEPRCTEQSEIVSPAQHEIGPREQGRTDLPQATIAAGTLETVFVPALVHDLQEVPFRDWLVTACTFLGFAD